MYHLMNKDICLLDFEIKLMGNKEYCSEVKQYIELPKWFEDIDTWVNGRSAAKHRKHIKEILKMCNAETPSGFIKLTHCLSLNDCLWVKSDDEAVDWFTVNLYDNEFNDVISKLSFDGSGLHGIQMSTTSPELTTDGAFDKCWVKENGIIKLIKVGSSGASNAGLEPYCETLSSQIFETVCDSVGYKLEKYHGRTVSSCELFTSQDYGYKPYADVFSPNHTIAKVMESYDNIGCLDQFRSMLIGDCVTINTDRHYFNFGFNIDNNTLKPVSINPAYDFNLALFPYADWYNGFRDMEKYQNDAGSKFGISFEELANTVMTSHLRSELINLKDLELTIRCDNKFNEKRLAIVNRFKNLQINKLLGNRVQFDFIDLADDTKSRMDELLKKAEGNKQ